MIFANKIKELREKRNLLQRHIASSLDIDTAIYCRIERGERKAKKEHVMQLANIYEVDASDLLNIWLADKVYDLIADEKDANNVLNLVAESIGTYEQNKK